MKNILKQVIKETGRDEFKGDDLLCSTNLPYVENATRCGGEFKELTYNPAIDEVILYTQINGKDIVEKYTLEEYVEHTVLTHSFYERAVLVGGLRFIRNFEREVASGFLYQDLSGSSDGRLDDYIKGLE